MKRRSFVATLCLVLAASPLAAATPPNADEIVREMRRAMQPDAPSVRVLTLVAQNDEASRQIRLLQARKTVGDEQRSLAVILQPQDVRGLAYLHTEAPDGATKQYVYAPTIDRARKLTAPETHASFLFTDFTYGDLGLLPRDLTNTVVGEEEIGGRTYVKVESTPNDATQRWNYSRYVTWIDPATNLPVRREFFSPAGERFKVQSFETVVRIDGIPTPMKTTMSDLPADTRSEMEVTSITYGDELPDSLLDPENLHELSEALAPVEAKALEREEKKAAHQANASS